MHIVIIVLTVLVSVLLICIVLVQKSKGGGLSSQFGGAGAVVGVRQANSFLEKGTWTLVGILVLLSIVSVWTAPKSQQAGPRTAPVATAPAAALPAAGAMDATPVAVPVATEATEVAVPVEATAEQE